MRALIIKLLVLSLLSILAVPVHASFVYTNNCIKAQQLIYKLRFKEAAELIDDEKTTHPENGIPLLLENYIDFLTIFINEDVNEFKRLEKNRSIRLAQLKNNDATSPYYKFCIAEVNFQWAIARLKFGEYVSAGMELKDTYNGLYDNIEEHPNFLPSYKTYGLLKALIGTVPEKYQWVAGVLGFQGSISKGIEQMNILVNSTNDSAYVKLFKYEAGLIEASAQLHLNKDKEKGWTNILIWTKDYETNMLSNFFRVNTAMHTGRNDEAITILNAKPRGDDYHKFYYLEYLLGLAKLQRLDIDADIHFKVYTTFFKGQNYIKAAYQKIAWFNLVNGNVSSYRTYMKMCAAFGNSETDEDKQANRESEEGLVPDKTLLSARLLFDGGYYKRAEALLKYKSITDFTRDKDQVELIYRKARISDAIGNAAMAIEQYNNTIILGKNLPYYFAANSSLHLGIIYEEKGDLEQAEYFYKKCKTFGANKEYQNSIEQKAKSGLNRISDRREDLAKQEKKKK